MTRVRMLAMLLLIAFACSFLAGCRTYGSDPIALGMTQDEVHDRWGEPAGVYRTITADGELDQWVYGYSKLDRCYVYFRNGRVVAYQD